MNVLTSLRDSWTRVRQSRSTDLVFTKAVSYLETNLESSISTALILRLVAGLTQTTPQRSVGFA